jgi:hypothetical protein
VETRGTSQPSRVFSIGSHHRSKHAPSPRVSCRRAPTSARLIWVPSRTDLRFSPRATTSRFHYFGLKGAQPGRRRSSQGRVFTTGNEATHWVHSGNPLSEGPQDQQASRLIARPERSAKRLYRRDRPQAYAPPLLRANGPRAHHRGGVDKKRRNNTRALFRQAYERDGPLNCCHIVWRSHGK